MPIITEDQLKVRDGYNPTKISFDSLKEEVGDAMKYDWKRDKVDDAKKRAIYTATNYDDFRQRVAGCTLKPIRRNEFNAPPKFAFNRQIDGSAPPTGYVPAGAAVPYDPCAGKLLQASTPATGLRNGREFEREFRRLKTAEDRVAIIEQLDFDVCQRLFPKDFDAEVLRHCIEALEEVGRSSASSAAVGRTFLSTLAVAIPGPVSVSASFLTNGDRQLMAQMLARDVAADPSEDVRICTTFGVPPSMVHAAAAAVAPVAGPELPPAPVGPEPAPAAGPEPAQEGPAPAAERETPQRPEGADAGALQHHFIGTPETPLQGQDSQPPAPEEEAPKRLFEEEEAPAAGGLIDGMD